MDSNVKNHTNKKETFRKIVQEKLLKNHLPTLDDYASEYITNKIHPVVMPNNSMFKDYNDDHNLTYKNNATTTLSHETASILNNQNDISQAVSDVLSGHEWQTVAVPAITAAIGCLDSFGGKKRNHIKRPMNAFMVWAQAARKRLAEQYPQMHNADLSKALGKVWRLLPEKGKEPFINRAKALKLLHQETHPEYKYQPRRKNKQVTSSSLVTSSCDFEPESDVMKSFEKVKKMGGNEFQKKRSLVKGEEIDDFGEDKRNEKKRFKICEKKEKVESSFQEWNFPVDKNKKININESVNNDEYNAKNMHHGTYPYPGFLSGIYGFNNETTSNDTDNNHYNNLNYNNPICKSVSKSQPEQESFHTDIANSAHFKRTLNHTPYYMDTNINDHLVNASVDSRFTESDNLLEPESSFQYESTKPSNYVQTNLKNGSASILSTKSTLTTMATESTSNLFENSVMIANNNHNYYYYNTDPLTEDAYNNYYYFQYNNDNNKFFNESNHYHYNYRHSYNDKLNENYVENSSNNNKSLRNSSADIQKQNQFLLLLHQQQHYLKQQPQINKILHNNEINGDRSLNKNYEMHYDNNNNINDKNNRSNIKITENINLVNASNAVSWKPYYDNFNLYACECAGGDNNLLTTKNNDNKKIHNTITNNKKKDFKNNSHTYLPNIDFDRQKSEITSTIQR